MLSLLGFTDKQLAAFFEVAESTLNKWKLDFPAFSESLKKGKDVADAKVATSLYNRAIGWKNAPPDVTACIFWLKNRQKNNWRDKQEMGLTDAEGNDVSIIFKPSNDEPLKEK